MLRKTPLSRGSSTLKRSPLAQISPKRLAAALEAGKPVKPSLTTTTKRAVPKDVTAAIAGRSGGWCEMQLNGCLGQATDACHRIKRGMGGRHGAAEAESSRLSDVIHGCRVCHQWTHARPTESYEMGLMLHEGQDPAMEPVLYRNEVKYLDDFGGVHDFEDVGA